MKGQAHRMFEAFVTALAAGAVFVGTAQAEPEFQAGQHVRMQQASLATAPPDAFERAVARAVEAKSAPVAASTLAVSDRPGQVATLDDAFRWGDALLGAGSALGLVLLGAVAVMTIRQRGRAIPH